MAVEWTKDYDQEFITELKVDMQNRQGALAELTNVISKRLEYSWPVNGRARWSLVHGHGSAHHQRSGAFSWHHAQNPHHAPRA